VSTRRRRDTGGLVARSCPLVDIEIVRAEDGGDGRTVTAYAAMFDDPYEVHDWEGDFFERLNRSAFNRSISHGARRFQVLYNHGMTVYQTPSERFSIPLGVPLDVRAEPRGLLTVTRYHKTELADEVLEAIRSGALTAQSWRGVILRTRDTGEAINGLPVKERLEIELRDYGPATFAVNTDAKIVGVRAQTIELPDTLTEEQRDAILIAADALPDEERDAFLAKFSTGTPDSGPADEHHDDQGTPRTDPPDSSFDLLAAEQAQRRRRA
jgi:HK97 family phage prohead protease